MKSLTTLLVLWFLVVMSSCEKDDSDRQPDLSYNPVIRPENFTDHVNHPFFPLVPGTIFTYQGQTADGMETTVTTVTPDEKIVDGVTCTVVHDVVSLDGVLIEDTYDWYAQDKDGNVWYFGEDVSNYENGALVDHEGSWETGVNGALPGILMLADPVLEFPYRQEYSFNVAEDFGKMINKDTAVMTTYGPFDHCIKTADWNALEPDAPIEYKYYAPNVGLVKEEVADGSETTVLISIH